MSNFRVIISLTLLLGLLPFFAGSQSNYPPSKEVRAVWITTVMGLDWPKTTDTSEQKRTLREMVRKLAKARFNTIFFQVRGRSDAMYKSHYEPWSHLLTGTLGKDPGWDPLEFILREAHSQGMEVHAWFNTFLVKSGKEKPIESTPRHLILSHPTWMKLLNGEWWLDPGLPESRNYLLGVAMDIVHNYSIDGIQFDFMRYPSTSYPDDDTWKKYGAGKPKDEWRRENIHKFVRAFFDTAMSVKPLLKIGSTPIGIYDAESYKNGFRGFDDVFQDARTWLREGKQDYIAPQVYWSLKGGATGPDFAIIARNWIEHSFGKHIYIGMGIYKPDVFPQIPLLIDTSRSLGAKGEAYFRYDHINKAIDSGIVYSTLANIPPMPWKDSILPLSPETLKIKIDSSIVRLRWTKPKKASDADTATFYNVYRSPMEEVNTDDGRNLIAILRNGSTSFTDTLPDLQTGRYFYAVTSVDKSNNESPPANEESILSPTVATLMKQNDGNLSLGNPVIFDDKVFISFEMVKPGQVILGIDDEKGGMISRIDKFVSRGRSISVFPVAPVKKGLYTIWLQSGGKKLSRIVSLEP